MSNAVRALIVAAATALLVLIGGIAHFSGNQPAVNANANAHLAPTPNPSGTPTVNPNASPIPIPTKMPTITVDAHGHPDYCKDQTAPFTGPPATQFGGANVMAAYCQMVAYTLDQSTWLPALLPAKNSRTAADFATVKAQMTPAMQSKWDTQVTAALTGNPKAAGTVEAVTFYNIKGVDGSAAVVNKKFSPGRAFVHDLPNGKPVLGMTITVTADIQTVSNGKPAVLPSGKTVTYLLTPAGNPATPWLIDDVTAQSLPTP